jgi:hypothetical protein
LSVSESADVAAPVHRIIRRGLSIVRPEVSCSACKRATSPASVPPDSASSCSRTACNSSRIGCFFVIGITTKEGAVPDCAARSWAGETWAMQNTAFSVASVPFCSFPSLDWGKRHSHRRRTGARRGNRVHDYCEMPDGSCSWIRILVPSSSLTLKNLGGFGTSLARSTTSRTSVSPGSASTGSEEATISSLDRDGGANASMR